MNARREIHREYRAIVRGHLTPESGVITAPLGRKDSSIIERTVDFDHGEKAVTYYQFLEEKNGHSLVSLRLGNRTHPSDPDSYEIHRFSSGRRLSVQP